MGERVNGRAAFVNARDLLLEHRGDPDGAASNFRWPELDRFNWATDFFDEIADRREGQALIVVSGDGTTSLTFRDLRDHSNATANLLREIGIKRGDRVLLSLGNVASLWEVMLAAIKLGAVVVPTSTLLGPPDLQDRIERAGVRAVVADSAETAKFEGLRGDFSRVVVGEASGWQSLADAERQPTRFEADGETLASDPLLLYFTSGTTARPKLVEHTHASYPVGHLSTMYWIGVRPGDVHVNISSPGWAKHAWSSFFAPWNGEATVLILDFPRFSATRLLTSLVEQRVTTFCAPPTVWRAIIQEDLKDYDVHLREAVAAGEPLNPEVIEQVADAWGVRVRDGYGQTETTCQIGNPPGLPLRPGSMGKPLPGYEIALVDPDGRLGNDGEICIDLSRRPTGLMVGYRTNAEERATPLTGDYYHTGDVASRSSDGYFTYVGRTDDIFKSSDYRISPFELESVLVEHPFVVEAAVIPSPDPLRLAVPKAVVLLAAGIEPTPEHAATLLEFCRERLAPFKRVRRIEFAELPKTASGKIRRVELRQAELVRSEQGIRGPNEYWEEDLVSEARD